MNQHDSASGGSGSGPAGKVGGSPEPGTTPQVDPRPGRNPGYDDANPRGPEDVPLHEEDQRGAEFGKLPNPDVGGLNRDPVVHPDPAQEK
ncbi:MAG TPA: hypothetical protein VIG68_05995 [Lysobacter sp.]